MESKSVDKEKLGKYVYTGYKNDIDSAFWQNRVKAIEFNLQQYLSDTNNAKTFPFEDCSNIKLPVTEYSVDNLAARINGALVGEIPFFSMLPLNDFAEKHKDTVETVMTNILYREVNIKLFSFLASFWVVLNGLAIAKPYPIVTMKGIELRCDLIDINHVIYPADTTDFQKVHRISHKFWVYPKDLKFRARSGIYDSKVVDKILEMNLRKAKDAGYAVNLDTYDKTSWQSLNDINELAGNKIQLIEQYLDYSLDGKNEEKLIVTIEPETKSVLRFVKLTDVYEDGRIPFYPFVYKPIYQMIGRGAAESLRNLQNEIDAIHNQTIDSGTVQIAPWFLFNPASLGINPNTIKIKPGCGIPVEDTNAVKWPSINGRVDVGISLENLVRSHMERLTSISDPQIGRFGTTRRTYGEIQETLSEGNIKHVANTEIIQKQFSDLLTAIYNLAKKYKPDFYFFRVSGKHKVVLDEDYDFILLGDLNSANPEREFKTMVDFYQIFANDPLLLNPNKSALTARLNFLRKATKILKIKNAEQYLPDTLVTDFILPTGEQIGEYNVFPSSPEQENHEFMASDGQIMPKVNVLDDHIEHINVHAEMPQLRSHQMEHIAALQQMQQGAAQNAGPQNV